MIRRNPSLVEKFPATETIQAGTCVQILLTLDKIFVTLMTGKSWSRWCPVFGDVYSDRMLTTLWMLSKENEISRFHLCLERAKDRVDDITIWLEIKSRSSSYQVELRDGPVNHVHLRSFSFGRTWYEYKMWDILWVKYTW